MQIKSFEFKFISEGKVFTGTVCGTRIDHVADRIRLLYKQKKDIQIIELKETVDTSQMIEVNIDTGSSDVNIVVENDNLDTELAISLFDSNKWLTVPKTTDMFDILVMLNLFKNKGQAKKNWKKTGRDIPNGFSHFTRLGKFNSAISIFNQI